MKIEGGGNVEIGYFHTKRGHITQNEKVWLLPDFKPTRKKTGFSVVPSERAHRMGRLVGYFITKRPVAGQKRRTIRPQVRPIAGPPSGHCLAGCGHSAVRSREQKRTPPHLKAAKTAQMAVPKGPAFSFLNYLWPLVFFAHWNEWVWS